MTEEHQVKKPTLIVLRGKKLQQGSWRKHSGREELTSAHKKTSKHGLGGKKKKKKNLGQDSKHTALNHGRPKQEDKQ